MNSDVLSRQVKDLAKAVSRLEKRSGLIVPISTFGQAPYEVLRDIKVVVQPSHGEFIATFFDANVNAAGPTETDAVNNLKDVMLGLFDRLSELPAKRLGPGPAKQLSVLRTFMKKRK